MAGNPYFNVFENNEATLYTGCMDEVIEMYGIQVYYIPRKSVNLDYLIGEDPLASFPVKYEMRMFLINTTGFGGQSGLLDKFGLSEPEEVEFRINQARFAYYLGNDFDLTSGAKPFPGDLIYIPWTGNKKLFEVSSAPQEGNDNFYVSGQQNLFNIRCHRFVYSHENIGDVQPAAMEEIRNTDDHFSDNTNIKTESLSLIDFTEENPFGE